MEPQTQMKMTVTSSATSVTGEPTQLRRVQTAFHYEFMELFGNQTCQGLWIPSLILRKEQSLVIPGSHVERAMDRDTQQTQAWPDHGSCVYSLSAGAFLGVQVE